MKDFYTENERTLIREIKTQTNRKTLYVHGLEDLMLCGVNTTQSDSQNQCKPNQNPNDFFFLESQGTPNSKYNLDKKNKARKIILSHFKTYQKPTVIKTVW